MLSQLLGLIRSYGLAGFWMAAGRLCFLLMIAVAARLVEPDLFGLFMIVLAASQVAAVFATLGTGAAAQFFIPLARERRRKAQAMSYILFAGSATVLGVAVLSGLFYFSGMLVSDDPNLSMILQATALFLLATGPSMLREMLARSVGAVSLALVPRDIAWTLLLCLLLVALPSTREHILLVATGSLLTIELLAFALLWLQHIRQFHSAVSPRVRPFKRWLRRSLVMMANTSGGTAFERIDTVLIGLLASLAAAGQYGVASRVAPIVSISNRFVSPVIFPRLAQAIAAKDENRLRSELRNGIAISLLTATPLFLAAQMFADELMALLGYPDSEAAHVLMILAVGNLFTSMALPFGAVIQMGPTPWQFTRCIWSWLIAVAIALPFALAYWGVIAAAATVATGMAGYSLSFIAMARHFLKSGVAKT
ncbi:MAG: hypothetical protein EP350_08750 [Alphaproteobacteria bacterium]|nr:MAG: hypothetical protein EP350_08750 [Alphaproteobacteria bacterium]